METKITMRKRARAALDQLTQDDRRRIGLAMRDLLVQTALWQEAASVFCFAGVAREPDTEPILQTALRDGKALYLPRCLPDRRGEMELVRVTTLRELTTQPNGLYEPIGSETALPEQIELALLPCVAASPDGMRLGHGGGYYDRFLSVYQGASVVLCPQTAVVAVLPHDALDRRAQYLLTENSLTCATGSI